MLPTPLTPCLWNIPLALSYISHIGHLNEPQHQQHLLFRFLFSSSDFFFFPLFSSFFSLFFPSFFLPSSLHFYFPYYGLLNVALYSPVSGVWVSGKPSNKLAQTLSHVTKKYIIILLSTSTLDSLSSFSF